MPVSKLMTSKIISCTPEDDLQKVKDLMNRHHIRHVLVLEDGNLIGVVSVRDIIEYEEQQPAADTTRQAAVA